MTSTIREAATLTTTDRDTGTATIALITPGRGSSGTYRPEVLETAAHDKVFPAGTQMFINHQTDQEAWAQPEGDLSKLAGVLTENARWDADQQALIADAKIYSHWRPILAEMRDDIGVSIRAAAEVSESDEGRVIERITEAVSVDFVTKAGRGGRIIDLIESAPQTSQPPAGKNTPDRKDTPVSMKEIKESEYDALTEKASRADTLEAQLAEAQTRIDALEAEKTEAARKEHVTGLVTSELEGVEAPKLQALLITYFLPEDYTDEDITAQVRDIASEIEPSTVRGLGESRTPSQAEESAPALPTWEELTAIKGA